MFQNFLRTSLLPFLILKHITKEIGRTAKNKIKQTKKCVPFFLSACVVSNVNNASMLSC